MLDYYDYSGSKFVGLFYQCDKKNVYNFKRLNFYCLANKIIHLYMFLINSENATFKINLKFSVWLSIVKTYFLLESSNGRTDKI